MRCAACGADLLAGKSFCHACGAAATIACPGCGQAIRPEFRFCPDCGHRLTPGEGAAIPVPPDDPLARHIPVSLAQKIRSSQSAVTGERKRVTVLFCDLVGSTAIAERLDPEVYHELLEEYLEIALSEVYRVEGIVNQLAGDGFMALFGAPLAHEDAPQRAVRAALAIHGRLAELNEKLRARREIDLQARIGIHTGPVVVGTVGNDLKMDYTAIGDTTNLASRLQSLAAPGSTLVSEATERLIRGFFTTRPAGPFRVKGKSELIAAHEVVCLKEAASAISVSAARGLTPLVGREEELAQLEACFRRLDGNLAQIVAVVGDAGSGKSRLLYEFRRRLDSCPVTFLEGRCASLSQAVPYAPFAAMLRQHFDIKPDDPRDAALDKIAQGLQSLDGGLEDSLPYLCHLLGVPCGDPPDLPADEWKRGTFEAVAHLVLAESRRAPVVMIVEDLHWIDESSREMLETAAAMLGTSRVMKIVSHRPDFQTHWRVRAAFTQLRLGRLSDAEATEMIRAIACDGLPEELERRIRAKAERNPLFIEEMTRGLFEEGYLVSEEGGVRVTRPVEEIRIPDTVQELLAARLDRLGPGAKRVVQVASALGRQFRRAQVEALLEGEGIGVPAELDAIERAGVIHRKTSLSRDEYRFGESLTQEVAYEGLLLRERHRLHGRIGTLLEEDGGDGSPERAALIARHFARSDNRRKAVETLTRAGHEAEKIPSYSTTLRLFREAWATAEPVLEDPDHGDEVFRRLALQAALGLCRVSFLYGTEDPEMARRAAEWGMETARAFGDDESFAMLCSLHGMNIRSGGPDQFDAGLALGEEGLAVARRAGLTLPALSIARGVAFTYLIDGRFEQARRAMDEVVQELERLGQAEKLSDLYVAVVWLRALVMYMSDDLDGAWEEASRAYDMALRAPNRTVQGGSAGLKASILFDRAEYAESRRWADLGLEMAERIGAVGPVRTAGAYALWARILLGEPVDSAPYLDAMEGGIAIAGNVPSNTRVLVQVFLAAGVIDRAEQIARLGHARAGGRLRQAHCEIALGDVMLAQGPARFDEAADYYARALDRARAIGSRSAEAWTMLGAGELALRRGDRAESARLLRKARTIARAIGLRHDARRAERLLAEIGETPS